MRFAATFTAFLTGVMAVCAAPLTRDLGMGLIYYRIHQLPGDLPPIQPGHSGPCVMDLRYVQGDRQTARLLEAWVKFNAAAPAPVILLANSSTGGALLEPYAAHDRAGVIVVGPASPGFHPDIEVKVDAATDRKAYDALEKGVALADLIDDKPEKTRVDEAMLSREHLSDGEIAEDSATLNAAPAVPRPLADAALQRALHIHRALLALKRL